MDQKPFGTEDFAENPEPRCPCMLLLDTSSSMAGVPISELNAGLKAFRDELGTDDLAAKRVEVACLTFGPPKGVTDFESAAIVQPPWLPAGGDTPMGAAIEQALDLVQQRKQAYRANGIAFYRPWVFLITDGAPTDEWQKAAARVKEGEASKTFAFFAVGVQGANMGILKQIAVREPLLLQGLKFRSLFQWLSNSMKSVSRSAPSDPLTLPNPKEGPEGWAQI
jgi:uncharacterized protein YegL